MLIFAHTMRCAHTHGGAVYAPRHGAMTKELLPSNAWQDTFEGRLFLATNVCYMAAGAAFGGNEPIMSLLLELASVCSIGYHYAQLRYGGTSRPIVQLAIALDYTLAVPGFVSPSTNPLSSVTSSTHDSKSHCFTPMRQLSDAACGLPMRWATSYQCR